MLSTLGSERHLALLVFIHTMGKNNLFPEHVLLSSTVVDLLRAAQSPLVGVCMKEAGREKSTYMNSAHTHQPLRNAGPSILSGEGLGACTQAVRATHHSAAYPLVLWLWGGVGVVFWNTKMFQKKKKQISLQAAGKQAASQMCPRGCNDPHCHVSSDEKCYEES